MSKGPITALDWIAADWGTSNLRVWAMGAEGPLAEAGSGDGMGKLDRAGFEPALLRLIGPWLPAGRVTPVIACGMVGARQGWQEAPYRATPCPPVAAGELAAVATHDPRISVHIVPGLMQSRPADVMRGEETQIAGALMLMPEFDGVLCLPGTHSKWARISAGEVVGFQSCMTGELFALLSTASVLRHGMAGESWDEAAFDAGVAEGIAHADRLSARLFSLRAEGLIAGLSAEAARSRLSGLLIGAELAATKGYWLGQEVALIGASRLAGTYARALAAQGVGARSLDASACTLAGLVAARGAPASAPKRRI